MEVKVESSKHMGHERTNYSGETVGKRRLRWEAECGNVTSPFVILGVTGFGNSWRKGAGTIAVSREHPVLRKESACLFPRIPA